MDNNYKYLFDADKYINEIIDIDKKFYKDEYCWSNEYQRKIYERNKNSFILIGNNEELVGYLNFLCITKDKYEEIKKSPTTVDNFELNEIIPFVVGENYITINSIVIKDKYQNGETIKWINNGFINYLKKLENQGIYINGITGIAISNDGQKYFEKLGFETKKELTDGNYLYIIEKDNDLVSNKLDNAIKKLKKKEA